MDSPKKYSVDEVLNFTAEDVQNIGYKRLTMLARFRVVKLMPLLSPKGRRHRGLGKSGTRKA